MENVDIKALKHAFDTQCKKPAKEDVEEIKQQLQKDREIARLYIDSLKREETE